MPDAACSTPSDTLRTRSPAGSRSRIRTCAFGGAVTSTSMRAPVRAMEKETGPKLVGASWTLIVFPSASHALGVENARSSPAGAPLGPRRSCTSSWRNVSRYDAFAPRVRRHVHRPVVRTVDRHDRDRLAGDVGAGRHPDREHAVEAEHELVGVVVVGHEARHAEAVHRPEARAVRLVRVDDVRIGARHAEQARAVRQHVVNEPPRLARVRREEPRCQRIRHDQVPVRAFADRGQLVVRTGVRRVERVRHEQRAVGQAPGSLSAAPNAGPSRC